MRDYFDEADVTCRFCIVNRELWREENPGARDPDWRVKDSIAFSYCRKSFILKGRWGVSLLGPSNGDLYTAKIFSLLEFVTIFSH